MGRYYNDDLYGDELYHFGIKGQKWGVRRFQNKDGSLTPEGRKRYGHVLNPDGKMRIEKTDHPVTQRAKRDWNDMSDADFYRKYLTSKKQYLKEVDKKGDPYAANKLGKAITKQRIGKQIRKNTGRKATQKELDEATDFYALVEPAAIKAENDRIRAYQETPAAKRRAALNAGIAAGYTAYTAHKLNKYRDDKRKWLEEDIRQRKEQNKKLEEALKEASEANKRYWQ